MLDCEVFVRIRSTGSLFRNPVNNARCPSVYAFHRLHITAACLAHRGEFLTKLALFVFLCVLSRLSVGVVFLTLEHFFSALLLVRG